MQIQNGRIMKATAGFYYVRCPDGQTIACKARGVFRKQKFSPLVGDRVTAEIEGETGTVVEIYERKNSLNRPPAANIDKLLIVASVVEPAPNCLLLDKLTAMAVDKTIQPILIFSKADLADASEYVAVYRKAGIESFAVSSETQEGMERFPAIFRDSVCVLTGNTGVGKSSLLNCLNPSLSLATSHISNKLGRGRHTTRTVELYEMCGGYIADTPGFSAFDFEKNEVIAKENLPFCFPEFASYIGTCRFVSCAHIGEKGCRICEAVKEGRIPESRYESYRMMYNEVKNYKEWEHRAE